MRLDADLLVVMDRICETHGVTRSDVVAGLLRFAGRLNNPAAEAYLLGLVPLALEEHAKTHLKASVERL